MLHYLVVLNKPLYELGITGIFTRTLDIAMLNNDIDIAVHSLKDVPTVLPKGIIQAAVLKTKLPLLDSYCDARRNAAEYYNNAFASNPNIITPITSVFSTHVLSDLKHCYVYENGTIATH